MAKIQGGSEAVVDAQVWNKSSTDRRYYRLYSDNWIEQGGRGIGTLIAAGTETMYNTWYFMLTKEMADDAYFAQMTCQLASTDFAGYFPRETDKYTTSIHYYMFLYNANQKCTPTENPCPVDWCVKGFIKGA